MTAIDALYRAHNTQLNTVLRRKFWGTPHVVEDAVQFAWAQLLDQPEGRIDEAAAFPWLYVVATREALRHVQRDSQRLVPLDHVPEPEGDVDLDAIVDARLLLERVVRGTTPRQLRALVLQASGLSHREIAGETGWTARTVDRQITRGRRRARLAVAA